MCKFYCAMLYLFSQICLNNCKKGPPSTYFNVFKAALSVASLCFQNGSSSTFYGKKRHYPCKYDRFLNELQIIIIIGNCIFQMSCQLWKRISHSLKENFLNFFNAVGLSRLRKRPRDISDTT